MMSDSVIAMAVALVGGAAVGVERQWSGHASGPNARFAGVRTFALLGALAGLSGQLWSWGATLPAAAIAAGASALVVAAYVVGSRHDVDGTTEVAALVVLAAGTAAGLGQTQVASGVIAVTLLLLVEKSRLHALIGQLEDVGLLAAARFAVMAAVVLPILPEGPYGPFGGIRPRQLWGLVIFFSGLSFAGYLARALVGSTRGYPVAGLLGGLVSSTSVTLSYARTSRDHPALAVPLAQGVVAANVVLFARVLVAAAVLNPSLATHVAPYFVAPFLVGAAVVVLAPRRAAEAGVTVAGPANPLQLRAALEMALAFQVVLGVVYLARQWFDRTGLLATAVALGLSDVDALTMSMARSVSDATLTPDLAALAVGVGILSNTCVKMAIAASLGRGRFRTVTVGALTAMGVALAATLVWRDAAP